MSTFEHTLRSIIDNIVNTNDSGMLSKLYTGLHNAKNNNVGMYDKYPSHLKKHAMCNTSVRELIQEWNQYLDTCSFDTSTLPVMWYMWTDSLDTSPVIHKPTPSDEQTGDMEELHSSNHRMYMIARKYKRNIKLLKSKYADRKKQLRDLAAWYEKFENNVKTLHISLSSIMSYIRQTVDTTDSCYSACPTDAEMKSMSFEKLVQTIEGFVKERNIQNKVDADTTRSYHIHQDDRPLMGSGEYPKDNADDDECNSIISSITDILEPTICSNCDDDEGHADADSNKDATEDLGPLINYSIQNINQLLLEAHVSSDRDDDMFCGSHQHQSIP